MSERSEDTIRTVQSIVGMCVCDRHAWGIVQYVYSGTCDKVFQN